MITQAYGKPASAHIFIYLAKRACSALRANKKGATHLHFQVARARLSSYAIQTLSLSRKLAGRNAGRTGLLSLFDGVVLMDLVRYYTRTGTRRATNNYDGRFWHVNSVAGTDTVDYADWGKAMQKQGIKAYDAAQYHIWTWLYRKDNSYAMYVDGVQVQSGTDYHWTYGGHAADEPLTWTSCSTPVGATPRSAASTSLCRRRPSTASSTSGTTAASISAGTRRNKFRQARPMLTMIGLGEGRDSLSLGAWKALQDAAGSRFSRANAHSALIWLQSPEGGVTFDAALDDLPVPEAVAQVLNAARTGAVVYVLPGHPLLGDPTGIPLTEAARLENIPLRVFAPAPLPAESPADFAALVAVMARLRDPQTGCPWDREQTPQTLRNYVIEEAYEVVEAIESGDPAKLAEELGDLLLQVVFHAQLARETGEFDMAAVTQAIVEKLIRRHPHVFGSVTVSGTEQVLQNWEQIKRGEKGYEDRTSILDGIPPALPALMRALEVSKRVVKVGFEWPSVSEVLDKVEEEIAELRAEIAAGQTGRMGDELGDLLFTLVNVARQLKIDPEDALRRMTRPLRRPLPPH